MKKKAYLVSFFGVFIIVIIIFKIQVRELQR